MARRSPRQKRALGLWTAAWLFVLLLVGVLRVGDLSLQWPVLLVPVVWALVALRPRRDGRAVRRDPVRPPGGPADRYGPPDAYGRDGYGPDAYGPEGYGPEGYGPDPYGPDGYGPATPGDRRPPERRRPPPTREAPWLPDVPRRPREE